MAVLDNILKPLSYLKSNIPGNTSAGTWNILPAVLSTWSNLIQLNNQVSDDSFALYKQQAQQYITTAKKNAQLIENQGAIALRNMQYKEKLERANDVLRVAASNSNLGGTHLDVIVRKEKIRKMNEMALRANYTNQALMELDSGYRQAAQAYGTMYQNARNIKWGVLNSVLKGIETYTGLTTRDAKVQNHLATVKQNIDTDFNNNMVNLKYQYEGTVPIRTNPGTYQKEYEVTDATSLNNTIRSYTSSDNLISPNTEETYTIDFTR